MLIKAIKDTRTDKIHRELSYKICCSEIILDHHYDVETEIECNIQPSAIKMML